MSYAEELERRMSGPQRHRLLQGYPMLPLMRPVAGTPEQRRGLDGRLVEGERELEPAHVTLDHARPLLVGVIPHAQCNPTVRGCGFCTFPHEPFDKAQLRRTVATVGHELETLFAAQPALRDRRVGAVYFGGATANLTPPAELRALAATLASHVKLDDAEVTLEGVPSLFLSLFHDPMELLQRIPARHRRLSMGVQTFDEIHIIRMGRSAFGDDKTVGRVVQRAHRRGFTVSGDFLINLPEQTREQMLADVRRADELGLDQICIYHLVLHEGMHTAWARPDKLAQLPGTALACEHWMAVRDELLARGFVQSTLTNFERAGVAGTARRFIYEEASFSPATWDGIGVGPHAISTFVNLAERRALKLVRAPKGPREGGWYQGDDLSFAYDEPDLRLLMVTRSLPRLRIERALYRQSLGSDVVDDFAAPLQATVAAGLVTIDEAQVALTPRGMFYADAVAGLLAWERAETLRPAAAGRHSGPQPRRRRQAVDRSDDFMG